MFIAVILTACGLGAPITGVSSLVSVFSPDLHLSHTAAGLLTTIPLAVFGLVSPLVGRFAVFLVLAALLTLLGYLADREKIINE